MKNVFLTTFTIICVNYCFSQNNFKEGYIITLANDTITGFINDGGSKENSLFCSFRSELKSNTIKSAPSEIKGYRFVHGKYYISDTLQYDVNIWKTTNEAIENYSENNTNSTKIITEKVFLEYLVNGISDLYYLRTKNGEFYFISDARNKLYQLDNRLVYDKVRGSVYQSKKFTGLLRIVMQDAPEMEQSIQNVNINHNSLIRLTKKYHDHVCEGEECVIYAKKEMTAKAKIGASFKTTYLSINSHFKGGTIKGSDYSISPSFYIQIHDPVIERFAIHLEFSYQEFKIPLNLGYSSTRLNLSDDSDVLKFKRFVVPFNFYYYPLSTQLKPFFGIGALGQYYTKSQYYIDDKPVATVFDRLDKNMAVGGQITLGSQYLLRKKYNVFVSISYDIIEIDNRMQYSVQTNQFSIMAGIGLLRK